MVARACAYESLSEGRNKSEGSQREHWTGGHVVLFRVFLFPSSNIQLPLACHLGQQLFLCASALVLRVLVFTPPPPCIHIAPPLSPAKVAPPLRTRRPSPLSCYTSSFPSPAKVFLSTYSRALPHPSLLLKSPLPCAHVSARPPSLCLF